MTQHWLKRSQSLPKKSHESFAINRIWPNMSHHLWLNMTDLFRLRRYQKKLYYTFFQSNDSTLIKKKAKSYQRRAIKALLSTGFGQICPISCGSTFPGSSHAMTVSEVPREMQSSPGQRPIPANEAWLSPVNAVTSHSGSKPKRSAMYLEILPKFSVEATGDPGGKLKNTVNAVMSHYGSKLKRSAMYLEIFPMFWVEETGDPGKRMENKEKCLWSASKVMKKMEKYDKCCDTAL